MRVLLCRSISASKLFSTLEPLKQANLKWQLRATIMKFSPQCLSTPEFQFSPKSVSKSSSRQASKFVSSQASNTFSNPPSISLFSSKTLGRVLRGDDDGRHDHQLSAFRSHDRFSVERFVNCWLVIQLLVDLRRLLKPQKLCEFVAGQGWKSAHKIIKITICRKYL